MSEQPVDTGPNVGPEMAPDNVDTSVRVEDGDQDVYQDPRFEEAETDHADDDDDPEVHEVA